LLFSTQLTNNFNVEENIIKVTNEHPFFVNGKWIEAKDLKVSDELLTADGKKARITNINDVEGEVQVYNLEVANYSDFVLMNGIVVHNSNKPVGKVDVSKIDSVDISYDSISLARRSELDNLATKEQSLGPIDLEGISNQERIYLYEQRLKNKGLLEGSLTDKQKKAFLAAHLSEAEGIERNQIRYNIAAEYGLSKERIKVGMDDWLMGIVRSRVKETPLLLKIAEDLSKDIKNEIDDLIIKFENGLTNPGIGNNYFKIGEKQIVELRSRNGARVYLSPVSKYYPNDLTKTDFEILGYSDKGTQTRVIAILESRYKFIFIFLR